MAGQAWEFRCIRFSQHAPEFLCGFMSAGFQPLARMAPHCARLFSISGVYRQSQNFEIRPGHGYRQAEDRIAFQVPGRT
jgi:hypothetical protein